MAFNLSTLQPFDFSARSDPRSGSVLMETVIVLPILLLVIGGLFILGDMAHGRLHLTAIDRAAAWGSANRFYEPQFKSWFGFVPKTTALRIERVKSDEILADFRDTKGERAAVTCRRGPPRPAASRTLRQMSAMALRSSSVSVGRPIMK